MPKFQGVNVSKAFIDTIAAGPKNHAARVAVDNLAKTIDLLHGVDVESIFGRDVAFDRIKFTDWSPDTCGCTVRYMWNRDHAEESRAHHPHSALETCEHHAGLAVSDHHETLTAENQHKNRSVGKLSEELGVEPREIEHSYDVDRTLLLRHACGEPRRFPRKG